MNFPALFNDTWEQSRQNILPLLINTLILLAVSLISFGILAPVAMAGYCSSIHRMVKDGREPQAADLFCEMRLFIPLAVFGLATLLTVLFGIMFFVLPGIIVIFALSFTCLYMIPLMVDKRLGIVDAVKESFAMARRGPVMDHILTILIIIGAQIVGGSFLLGTLVTTPLTTVFLMNVYEYKLDHDFL
ncbi:MAG: hypothetical protein V1793_25570 [Pseudomonadota bacterium]